MKRRLTLRVGLFVLAGILIGLTPSSALAEIKIYGDLLASYRSPDTGVSGAEGVPTFQLDQFDLSVQSDLSDYASAYARGTFTPNNSSITEAWIRMSGLPYNMEFTFGRFYRPLGVRLPTVGQSHPSLVLHSFSDVGIKFTGEWEWLNWEAGLVNGRRLSATQATIGNIRVLSNASATVDADQHKDVYGHLGVSFGESWGSLDLGVGGVSGRLTDAEINIINPYFNNPTNKRTRGHLNVSLDYTYRWLNLFGEYDHLQDGQLKRELYTAALTGRYRSAALTVGYDYLDPKFDQRVYAQPITWRRETVRVSGRYEITPSVIVQSEYQWNDEDVLKPNAQDIDNNMWISQMLVYF